MALKVSCTALVKTRPPTRHRVIDGVSHKKLEFRCRISLEKTELLFYMYTCFINCVRPADTVRSAGSVGIIITLQRV